MKDWSNHMAHRRDPLRSKVCELYQRGLSLNKIAETTGKNRGVCFKWIKQAGILEIRRVNKIAAKTSTYRATRLILCEYQENVRKINRLERVCAFFPEIKKYSAWKKNANRTAEQRKRDNLKAHKTKMSNPARRAMFYARKRVANFIRQIKQQKTFSVSQFIGCNSQTLKAHIEYQFRDGMTWENHGTVWELDHRIPLSSTTNETEIKQLCHYTNLQPLLKQENREKSDKIFDFETCIEFNVRYLRKNFGSFERENFFGASCRTF